jgi:hypothetical protein
MWEFVICHVTKLFSSFYFTGSRPGKVFASTLKHWRHLISCAKYSCACTENGGSLDARCGQFTVREYLAKDFPHLQPEKIPVIRPRNLLLDLKARGGPCQCDNYMVTL